MGTLVFINQKEKVKTTAFQCQKCGISVKIETDIETIVKEQLCDSCANKGMRRELALK